MKIVYCIPSIFNSGGMERVLAQKANYLADKLNWDVTIITSSQKDRDSFYKFSSRIRMIDLGINYDDLKELSIHKRVYRRIISKKIHKQNLKKVLLDLRPDITISMFTHEMPFLYKINDGSKKVLELHFSKNFRTLDAKSNGRSRVLNLIGKILDYVERRKIAYYDKFVVLTERDAKDWGTKYKNIQVIPNPSSFVSPAITDSNNKMALAVGRLCAQKGFDQLIDVWNLLPQDLKNSWHLNIVGSGPDEQILREKISINGLETSVSILPPCQEIHKIYLSHSIFCFPSRYEGFGLALIEAMSFGLVPVAYDCPCGPSDIIENNVNGFIIENDQAEDFANKLKGLMIDGEMRHKIGQSAKKHINSKFSPDSVMAKWKILFKELK